MQPIIEISPVGVIWLFSREQYSYHEADAPGCDGWILWSNKTYLCRSALAEPALGRSGAVKYGISIVFIDTAGEGNGVET